MVLVYSRSEWTEVVNEAILQSLNTVKELEGLQPMQEPPGKLGTPGENMQATQEQTCKMETPDVSESKKIDPTDTDKVNLICAQVKFFH